MYYLLYYNYLSLLMHITLLLLEHTLTLGGMTSHYLKKLG